MKKQFFFKILALLMPLFFVCLVEFSSFVIIKKLDIKKKFTMKEFVSKKNSSFKSIPDFEKIRSQLLDKSCKKIIYYDNKNQLPFYYSKNHKCYGETVEDGLRKTYFQNINPQKKIYVFGGSTVWGTGSSDQFTIPSILQKKINSKNSEKFYNVYNYGFSTLVSHQQFKLLKQIKINKGDIIIFYDGNNDIWQANINKNPYGTIIGYNSENKVIIFKNKIKFFLNNNSYFLQLIQKSRGKEKLECSNFNVNKDQIKKNFKIYIEAIEKAKEYTMNKGGVFYHFFQPTLFTRASKTEFEEYMISTMPSPIMPCNSKNGVFEAATNYYFNNYETFATKLNGYNLGSIFDKYDEDFFIDLTHVNSLGNKIIANKIFEKLNLGN